MSEMLKDVLKSQELVNKQSLNYFYKISFMTGVNIKYKSSFKDPVKLINASLIAVSMVGLCAQYCLVWYNRKKPFVESADAICTTNQVWISVLKLIYSAFVQHELYDLLRTATDNTLLYELDIFDLAINCKERLLQDITNILIDSWSHIRKQLIVFSFLCLVGCGFYMFSCLFVNYYFTHIQPQNITLQLPLPALFPMWHDYGMSLPYYPLQYIITGTENYISGMARHQNHRRQYRRQFFLQNIKHVLPVIDKWQDCRILGFTTNDKKRSCVVLPSPNSISMEFYNEPQTKDMPSCYAIKNSAVCFDGLFIIIVVHCSALFEILHRLLEHATDEDVPQTERVKYLICCVRFHEHIFRYVSKINNIYRNPSLIQFVLSMLILCVVMLMANVGLKEDIILFLKMLCFLFAAGFQIAIYCYNGQKIITQSEISPSMWYGCSWYNECKEFRQIINMMVLRTNRTLYLKVSDFANMSHVVLISIIQTSYSYFLFLKNLCGIN